MFVYRSEKKLVFYLFLSRKPYCTIFYAHTFTQTDAKYIVVLLLSADYLTVLILTFFFVVSFFRGALFVCGLIKEFFMELKKRRAAAVWRGYGGKKRKKTHTCWNRRILQYNRLIQLLLTRFLLLEELKILSRT